MRLMKRDEEQGDCSRKKKREKGKHQGYVFKSLGHAAVSTAKRWGDCCVFANMADEVMVQTITLANRIM